MFGKKEMERTCKRDGTVWYCSIKDARAKKPNAMIRLGASFAAAGDSVSPFSNGKGQMQQINVQNKMNRLAQVNACPTCGSSKFKQKIVRA